MLCAHKAFASVAVVPSGREGREDRREKDRREKSETGELGDDKGIGSWGRLK